MAYCPGNFRLELKWYNVELLNLKAYRSQVLLLLCDVVGFILN